MFRSRVVASMVRSTRRFGHNKIVPLEHQASRIVWRKMVPIGTSKTLRVLAARVTGYSEVLFTLESHF